MTPERPQQSSYRPGVGIMLLNARGEVFVGRRIDMEADAWHMPQGGIETGEHPREAALRELEEEIGTGNVDVLAESRGWLCYDVPPEFRPRAWGGRWTGQRQKWFVMQFKGRDAEIDVATPHPEFNAWRWVSVDELPALAVSFKRRLYDALIGEFPGILRNEAAKPALGT